MSERIIDARIVWKPFVPREWHDAGSCYPCLVWDTRDNMVWAPCDPWTLPPENDYSDWLCTPVSALIGGQR